MTPIKTPETNVVFGANQQGVFPLPCHREPNGDVYTTWELTEQEKAEVASTGKIYIMVQTFNRPLQPMIATTENPFLEPENAEENEHTC